MEQYAQYVIPFDYEINDEQFVKLVAEPWMSYAEAYAYAEQLSKSASEQLQFDFEQGEKD